MLIHKIGQFYRVRKERIQKKIVYKFQLMLRVFRLPGLVDILVTVHLFSLISIFVD